jgi:hypothetical protein
MVLARADRHWMSSTAVEKTANGIFSWIHLPPMEMDQATRPFSFQWFVPSVHPQCAPLHCESTQDHPNDLQLHPLTQAQY